MPTNDLKSEMMISNGDKMSKAFKNKYTFPNRLKCDWKAINDSKAYEMNFSRQISHKRHHYGITENILLFPK